MLSASSTVRRKAVHWSRWTTIATLLLATVTLVGEFAESHHHDLLGCPIAQGDPSTPAAEREQRDRTVQIEGATRTESDSCSGCIGCLTQQRKLSVGTSVPVLGGFEPEAAAITTESDWTPGADARRLKPSRAPPLA